tara:strand:- start:4157 stop:4525 length:369 start_codon:yes stop_codon:yes gene_type:complete
MKAQILCIDNDHIINFIHSKIIRKKYPNTPLLFFENGQRGLLHIKNNPNYDYLIFLDINMPEMNGWEFLTAITKQAPDVKLQVHILTSSVYPQDMMLSKKYNKVFSFLAKPLRVEVLEKIDF